MPTNYTQWNKQGDHASIVPHTTVIDGKQEFGIAPSLPDYGDGSNIVMPTDWVEDKDGEVKRILSHRRYLRLKAANLAG